MESIKAKARGTLTLIKNTRIIILKGGPSPEHDISLATAAAMREALASLGFKLEEHYFKTVDSNLTAYLTSLARPSNLKPLILNALHGEFGEDGGLSRMLDSLGLTYTHSKTATCALAIDKKLTKEVAARLGLHVAPDLIVNLNPQDTIDPEDLSKINKLGFPLVVKSNTGGSSIDTFIIHEESELLPVLEDCASRYSSMLAEGYLSGADCSVGLMESQPLEVTEIVTSNEFYDYSAKYSAGGSQHILPARVDEHLRQYMLESAQAMYKALGCQGVARVDFKLHKGKAYFLELNTHPGMTVSSLLPEQARYLGLNMTELCLYLLASAVEHH